MKKAFVSIFAAAVLLSGCASSGNSLIMNEKKVPDNMGTYNNNEVVDRINDIKNGATPKVKPTGEEDPENGKQAAQAPAETKAQYQTQLKINEETKNMNIAVINTNKGAIKVELNPDKAPLTVENFKHYAAAGYFSNTIFHRVMPNFMIQGGGFLASGEQKKTELPIKIESDNGLKNNRGTIAMARTQDPNSATSQFFINLIDNDFLNYSAPSIQGYGYAVFGEVIEGMDVVDAIAQIDTDAKGPHANWPKEDIVIESITLEE